MGYFMDVNEETEYKRLNGRLYLYVIHRKHPHNGMMPHAHVLDLTELRIGQAEVSKDFNKYCDMAKESGEVIPYY